MVAATFLAHAHNQDPRPTEVTEGAPGSPVLASLSLLTLLLTSPARAQAPAEPLAQLGPTALEVALPYPPKLQEALATRDWRAALPLLDAVDRASVPGNLQGDHAFVRAWVLARADRERDGLGLLEVARNATNAPPEYVGLVVGETLLAAGRPVEAIPELERITGEGPIVVRARLALARAYDAAERRSDATKVYEALANRPDPAPGSSVALRALLTRSGEGSPASKTWHRRLFRHYPGSAEDKAAGALPGATPEDLAWRADRMQEKGDHAEAVALLDPHLAAAAQDACVLRFAWGRAQFKRNNITAAAGVLEPLGTSCRGKDDDRGAKALYLAGKAYERTKRMGDAARVYRRLAELYPAHSMADDGYALGGIALQEAGDLAGARGLWAKGAEAYPKGDLAAENTWRLAWGAWLAGDMTDALRWADHARDTLSVASNPTDVLASVYWGARWRAWPSRGESRARNKDAEATGLATRQLETLAREAPWHWYGMLAAQRLRELAPERAKALVRPPMDPDTAPWQVRESWRNDANVRRALGLVRTGLVADALAELDALDDDTLSGAEVAIACDLQTRAGKFLYAHDRLRAYLKTHPPETLGPNAWKVMRQAYPLRWWPEVDAAHDYAWDARLFHALVREESNFNPDIESHVGAKGLSQLMPATAASTARRMKLAYRASMIKDPATNLKIGANYLDMLVGRYRGNGPWALAGYNAGEGNADRWLTANPDAPMDQLVESITFRETRHYVKRVSSSWQTYRLLYENGALYPDLSAFTYDAVP